MPTASEIVVGPQRRPLSGRLLLATTLTAVGLGGCEKYFPTPLEPAAYSVPQVGTVYRYRGFTNRVTDARGMTVSFVDDSGRAMNRIATFITEDPAHPIQFDGARLAPLWPLKIGNKVVVPVRVDAEQWQWTFEVTGEQLIETQAGEFRTFVVDALQERLDSASGPPVSIGYTLNYAPSVGAVVRFQTSILGGPGQGRSFGSELRAIYRPDDALKKP